MATRQAATAVNRFGLGARANELQQIGGDPRGWLLSQLGATAPIPALQGLTDSAGYLDLYASVQQQRSQLRKRGDAGNAGGDTPPGGRNTLRRALQQELVLRQQVAVTSAQGFRERLVRFWSNHFAISIDKRIASLFAAPMEREAIRPHASGRFADLLLAVEHHPGMLLYLDNAQSIGSDSRLGMLAARRGAAKPNARKRGLNENLAREILELHTVGVDAGYSQQDVIEFARAITGWSVARRDDRSGLDSRDGFVFRAAAHEPGVRNVFGTRYRQSGEQQGVAILRDLAVHPATARHLSLKLARHFVADQPPPMLVERMVKTWLASEGDLARVCQVMVEDDLAWQSGLHKFKTPDDFFVSALRGCGLDAERDIALALQMQGKLGQPIFQPRSPAGFADVAAEWSGQDALFKRVQAAQAIADRVSVGRDMESPLNVAQSMLGDSLDNATAVALRRAESVQQGIALLLASPVFQWRS